MGMIHQGQALAAAGEALENANSVLILMHGRGASAESMLPLAEMLISPGMAALAPQAHASTWYPYSFLAPIADNEPWLSSALQTLADLVTQVEQTGIPVEKILIGGFSQGACLAAEFTARHARHYGGLLLFSGGLIGPPGTPRAYRGSLAGTPVFLGCDAQDPHIPLWRVEETTQILEELGGKVYKHVYQRMGHTIIAEEIEIARQVVILAE